MSYHAQAAIFFSIVFLGGLVVMEIARSLITTIIGLLICLTALHGYAEAYENRNK